MPQPTKLGIQLVGKHFLREYPYRDAYLLDDARQIRAAVTMPLVLLGGITGKASMDLAMEEGFQFVAIARALLREPDLVNRITAETHRPGLCNHCNKCMTAIYGGTHCVLRKP
jgi:2,4-dienoyl-CoA reductase-like NADH-dependent reductase (Old Yellow Enzyme family)